MDKQHARELWEVVHKNTMENWSNDNVSLPLSKMNLERPKWNEVDPNVMQDEILSLESQPSQISNPFKLGQYIGKVATLHVPLMKKPRVQDTKTTNL